MQDSNNSLFKTIKNKPKIDPYLNVRKFILINKNQKCSGEIITWKAGEILSEGSSCVVYKALNMDEGSIFVVKRFLSFEDSKTKEIFQVKKLKLKIKK